MPALIAAAIAAGTTFGTQLAIGATVVAAAKAAAIIGVLTFLTSIAQRRGELTDNFGSIVRSSVMPARWILGRARVGGMLVFYDEQPKDLDTLGNPTDESSRPTTVQMAVVISEGPIDGIEKVWANGEEVPIISRTADNDGIHLNFGGPLVGNIAVWEYFAADGTGGHSLRVRSPRWTTQHKLIGKSWVHIELNQNDYGDNPEDRVWDGFPEIEFLIRGQKISWPGQVTPVWTENAAAIRYWHLVELCGIDPNMIDLASFHAAYATCNERIDFQIPPQFIEEGYQRVTTRYTINGVITSEDNLSNLTNEFDFCWQGNLVEANARYYFRPGEDRVVTETLTDIDILEVVSIQVAPILQDRVNSMSMELLQSNTKQWQRQDIPRQTDELSRLNRDNGEELWLNLGSRRFIQNPVVAIRLLAIALRRAQNLDTYIYRVAPGTKLQWLRVIPGDYLTLNHEALDIQKVVSVVSVQTNEDWSTTLVLQGQNRQEFYPTLVLPTESSTLMEDEEEEEDMRTGDLKLTARNDTEPGYAECDGGPSSRTGATAALFAAIGTTYGSGDGATTFNRPDLRGRVPIGAGQGVGLTNRSRGDTGGAETHQLTEGELARHRHPSERISAPGNTLTIGADSANGSELANNTGFAGNDEPHNNMQPFLGVRYIIKL